MKRTLSLLLSLLMVFSLFAGIAPKAQANDLIADLLERYLFKKDALDTLLGEGNLVKQGYCGKSDSSPDDPAANVWYQIYQVDTQELMNSPYFQTLSDNVDDGYLPLEPTEDYYAVKIFGNGDMFDYKRNQSAPWCDKVTLTWGPHAGEIVDMDKKLVLAYVAGAGNHKVFSNGHMTTATYTGVKNVGQFAFFGQDNLYGVYLGETVKRIEDRAFESTEMLAAINAPNALEYLGKRAFYGCDKLTFFRAGNTKLTEIGERAFYGCSLLASVQLPANLKVIDKMAFAWCRILGNENFVLPSGLTTIGDGAFMFDTHLGRFNEINFPKNLTTIGNYAFLCCFGIGKGENDGISFTAGGSQPLSIGNYAFAGCRELKHLKLDNRVTNIHTGAFAACERLESVAFGNDQNAKRVSIDSNAFTSAQSTMINALEFMSNYVAESDDEENVKLPITKYDSEELEAFSNLNGMTPLCIAAFQNRPASAVKIASDANHSFPVDCVIHYPTASYNPAANAEWLDALDASGTTWKGYPTQGDWNGHIHNYKVTESKDATHTQDGSITYTCSICKDSYTEIIPMGHDFEEYNRQEPTCTEDGVVVYHCKRDGCSYPNGYYTETLPATGHDPDTVVTVKEPTCTEDGRRMGYCSRCKQTIDEVIPAKGHNLAMMTVVQPVCNKDGYAYGYCVDCHATISKDAPIILPAPGIEHEWDSGVVTKQPTCEENGVRTFTCTACGDKKTETIPALGHTTELRGATDPTCTETGYTGDEVCTVCGAIVEQGTEISALGHEYAVTTTPPTCTKQGYTTHSCIRCDHVYVDSFVDALGHHTELRDAKEPTCVDTGYTGDEYCTVCDELVSRGESIPATGHSLILENEVEATCTANGYSGDQVCSVCGKIIKHGNVIPATGHELKKENAVPATCTQDGYTGDQVCSICGEIVKKGEVIKATGHKTEQQGKKDATCTEDGYTGDEVCTVCGETVKKGEVIKATGHNWDAGKVTTQPTETAEGVKTFTCTVCGETRTESIPKLTPSTPTNPFVDVKQGAYYYDPVLWAVNHNPQITNGTSENTFSPDATCTRGQVVTFLWRAKGCPEPKSAANPFKDVASDAYYYKAVLWANENGITNGTSATTFSPEDPCTRAQVVTFLWRAEGKPAADGNGNPFADVPSGQYYTTAVLWAVNHKPEAITNGTSANAFSPDATCTRGQIVTFLYRAVKK